MPRYKHQHYVISTSKSKLDIDFIHSFLRKSYWAKNIQRELVETSIKNSVCFGLYMEDTQIGFARVITDYARFAYLADVFIVRKHRGKGLAKWLLSCIMKHPEFKNIKGWMLATQDAHGLYKKFGFHRLYHPEKYMQLTIARHEK